MNDTYFFNQFHGIENYNYREAVTEAIRDELKDPANLDNANQYCGNAYGFIDDNIRDAVTGNADGSYWCNAWTAECCLYGNRYLLEEYADWQGFNDIFMDDPEVQDVKVREYLFNGCMESAFDDLLNELASDLTDAELYLLIVLNSEWDDYYMAEAAKRVDMADAWKNADAEDFEEVADEIISKLKEQA